jgi:hypothetical protein
MGHVKIAGPPLGFKKKGGLLMADAFPDFRKIGGIDMSNLSAPSIFPWGRLYNFKTGHFDCNENHRRWIKENLVPLYMQGNGTVFVQLWGYASKIGNATFNNTLSLKRAAEVKKVLNDQIKASWFRGIAPLSLSEDMERVIVGGYGTSHSGGNANDNSPIFRGVDVYVCRTTAANPVPPPDPVKPPEIKAEKKMYIGPGVKGGGFLAVAGGQTLEAHLYSVDDYNDQFNVDGEIWNLGLGLGGGVNVVMAIGYGGTKPGDFCGCKFGGPDFNISVGERWAELVKGVKKLSTFGRIANALKDSKMTMQGIKLLWKLSPSEWEQMSNLAKALRDASNTDSDATRPQFNSFDIPMAGVGVEIDAYYSWGQIKNIY